MIRRPPRSTRTDTLFPYTTLFRSDEGVDPVPSVEIAGNVIAPDLLTDLSVKTLFELSPGIAHRTLRLASDPGEADRKVAGVPLWRRSEPGNDHAFAQILAEDIADWIAICER